MKITVVTVCYNAESIIENTINSVLGQTYQDMEYIIQDGASTDATMDIVKKYANDTRIVMHTEKDTGVYNAMNNAIDKATGEYIIFMNAGDRFYDNRVIDNVSSILTRDIVYGGVSRVTHNGKVVNHYKDGRFFIFKCLLKGEIPCHQSIFVRTDLMKAYKFDESFSIKADNNFVMRAYKQGASFGYANVIISEVDNTDGLSSRPENYDEMRRQDDKSLKACMPGWYMLIHPLKVLYRKIKK